MDFEAAIAPCADYSEENCIEALKKVLEPLGGLDFVKAGDLVAIKANLVTFLKPEAAATTHPALLSALTKLLLEKGAKVVIGDSPGGLYNGVFLDRVYKASGMEKTGAALNRDFSVEKVSFPQGRVLREFEYTAYLSKADHVINFCKLKSHGMMVLSNGAKNLFGVIPGTKKPEYHYRFPDPMDFARMIVDLNDYVKPALTISDGVLAMEGNGPTAGTPRKLGFVAASKNPHKLDLLCGAIIGLKLSDVPTLKAAFERGYIPERAEELKVFGEWRKFITPDFEIAAQKSIRFSGNSQTPWGKAFAWVAEKALESRPQVKKGECIGCKKCAEICPAKAIVMEKGLPQIDKQKCIKCFCCQEFCPKGAMKVHRTAVARLLFK